MTRIYGDQGQVIPVTLISCPPSEITQIKTVEHDGYQAIVLGFEALKKPKKTKKFRFMREFKVEKPADFKIGDKVTVETFKEVKSVSATGISKGKGFAGVIKLHNFSSGPGGHGSHNHREPGSIGARSKPGRIHKGKRMAGRMGNKQVTRKLIPLIEIHSEKNLLVLKGAVPGPNGSLIIVKSEK